MNEEEKVKHITKGMLHRKEQKHERERSHCQDCTDYVKNELSDACLICPLLSFRRME
jgi:hypothetical protein